MVAILMATHNGENYLKEQLDSLFTQTYQDFVLYVSDDSSTDATCNILQSYQEKYPNRIFLCHNDTEHHGAKHNFMQLIMRYKAQYVMLCDQDDVWKPRKIEVTMQKMLQMEKEYGEGTPILVHTDLEVVDQSLQTVSPSFKEAMGADYSRTQLRQIIIQNVLTGCTALYNRALAELLTVEPPYMIMHDWWLVLVASAFGVVGHIDEQTILYRQHGNNVIGAKNVHTTQYIVKKLIHWREMKQAINETYQQAESLLEVYKNQLAPGQIDFLQKYCAVPKKNKLGRLISVCRLGTLKCGFTRKIANFIVV